jgi:hypothetical protein
MFHISLSLPCQTHVIVALDIHEPPQPVLLSETLDKAGPVFQARRARSSVTPTYSVPFGRFVMM